MFNGKIRVVENIGENSFEAFGKVGTEFEVVDGMLTDLEDWEWDREFETFDELKTYFDKGRRLNWVYRTIFELAIDEESIVEETTSNSYVLRVVKNIGHGSKVAFGGEGTHLTITNGVLKDLQGFEWTSFKSGGVSYDFKEPNEFINYLKDIATAYRTEFELVEDDEIEEITEEIVYTTEPVEVVTYDENDYKIRVVENIGESSKRYFGEPGVIHNVINGELTDLEGDTWTGQAYGVDLKNFEALQRYFLDSVTSITKFELVVEDTTPQPLTAQLEICTDNEVQGVPVIRTGDVFNILADIEDAKDTDVCFIRLFNDEVYYVGTAKTGRVGLYRHQEGKLDTLEWVFDVKEHWVQSSKSKLEFVKLEKRRQELLREIDNREAELSDIEEKIYLMGEI